MMEKMAVTWSIKKISAMAATLKQSIPAGNTITYCVDFLNFCEEWLSKGNTTLTVEYLDL